MKKLFIGLFLSLLLLPSIANATIIPDDRVIGWKPGIPGGIPYYPVEVNE